MAEEQKQEQADVPTSVQESSAQESAAPAAKDNKKSDFSQKMTKIIHIHY